MPGDPLYEQFTSEGDRIVIDAHDDALGMKIRRRRHSTRVFDAKMIPLGQVRIDDDRVEQRSLDGTQRTSAEWIDDDTAHMPDAWRIERTDNGWDIFDADATVIALLRRSEDQWTLRPTRGDVVTLTTSTDGGTDLVVDGQGHMVLNTRADRLSSVSLLILAIDELDPLHRYSLATFADLHF